MEFTETEAPVTTDELSAFEAAYGVTLPQDYRDHIVRYNGGVPEASYLLVDDEEYFVASLHPIQHGEFTVSDVLDALRGLPSEVFPPHYYPFADDAFGNSYCLDLETGDVVFWSQDTDESGVILADSFSSFLDALTEDGEAYEF